MLMGEVRGEVLLRRLPLPVRESLTKEQIDGIRQAAHGSIQMRHPIDVRWSLPMPIVGRVYFVLALGREKRSPVRRRMDRRLNPADHLSEALLIGFSALVTASAMLIGVLFYDSILGP
jgi:hypothetical protein